MSAAAQAAPYFLLGADTYGWPPVEEVWAPAQRSWLITNVISLTQPSPPSPTYFLFGADTYGWPAPVEPIVIVRKSWPRRS